MSVSNQRDFLLKYLKDNNHKFINEYIDDGYTGLNFDRPSFKKMIDDINNNVIDMVVVKDFSRLGRNNSKTTYYMEEYFPLHNIRYIAINNNYDSHVEDTAKELAWITNGFNEMYSKDISKKVRTGLATLKQKGKFTGFKAPYGYKRDEVDYHKLIVDNEVKDVVVRIFNMAKEGKSTTMIASILNNDNIKNPSRYANLSRSYKSATSHLWNSRTIDEMLTNETYIGNMTQGKRKKISYKLKKEVRLPKSEWIIIENTHEAIISKDLFNAVQNLNKKNNNKQAKSIDYLLRGFLYCTECEHKIGVNKSSDNKRFYTCCRYYTKYSKYKLCTPHSINYIKLEEAVISEIKNLFKTQLDLKNLEKNVNSNINTRNDTYDIKINIRKINGEIDILNKQIDKVYMDYVTEIISLDRYKNITNKLNDDIKNKEEMIKLLEMKINDTKVIKKDNSTKKIINEFLNSKKIDKELLSMIIDVIHIDKNKNIEIKYKFKLI